MTQFDQLSDSQLPISLDTLLLFVLGAAHMWFSQVVSALMVILMALYLLLDLRVSSSQNKRNLSNHIYLGKFTIVFLLLMIVVAVPMGWEIIQRIDSGPHVNATDSLVQTEVAISFFLEGKNPYEESYLGTAVEDWQGGEPPFSLVLGPLHHFVYLPNTFLLGAPLQVLFTNLLGWYGQRIFHLIIYVVSILLIPQLVVEKTYRLTLLILIGLNFTYAFHLIEGRNDIVILFWMIVATLFLAKKHIGWAAFAVGMSLATKHQAWFFLPFFLVYTMPRDLTKHNIRKWFVSLWPMYLVVLVIIGVFFLWNPQAFFADTVGYIVGLSEYSFPIRGIGFSHLLVAFGFLSSYEASFPFIVVSLIISIPILILGLRYQWRDNSLSNLWLAFAFFAFSFQFFSRFFNDNYFIFVIQAICIGAFINIDKFNLNTLTTLTTSVNGGLE